MSFQTAPVGLVMTAIVAGPGGSGRLRAVVEQPLGRQPRLQRLEAQGQVAEPRRLDRFDVELERALRLEQVDPAVGDDPQPGLRLERRAQPVVAEPDALELVALVLEREVGVPGRRDRDPADLALDPQVGQARVGADRAADRPGDLADAQDPDAERAGRRRDRAAPAAASGRAAVAAGRSGSAGIASQLGSAQSGGSRRSSGALDPGLVFPGPGVDRGSCRPARRRSGPGRRGRSRSWPACGRRSGCRRRSPARSRRPARSTVTGSSTPIVSPW